MNAPLPLQSAELDSLAAELHPEVCRYLRFLGCEVSEAEDLTQECFAQLLARGGEFEFRGAAAALGWLRRAARNLFLAARRREAREPGARELDIADAVWEAGAGAERRTEYLAALDDCVGRLSPSARRVLRMRYEGGMSRQAIGAAIGRAPDGVKTLLRRIRDEIRACLRRKEESGE